MDVTTRIKGKLATVNLQGRLTAEVDYRHLHDSVDRLLEEGVVRIALDMKQVDFLDCSGIGHLILCYQKATKHQSSLQLTNVDRRFLMILGKVQLLEVFAAKPIALGDLAPNLSFPRAQSIVDFSCRAKSGSESRRERTTDLSYFASAGMTR